jgi:hypothetical protein
VCLALELGHTKLEHEIAHHRDGEHTHARAHDVHWRIIEDDDGLPRSTQASQNIAAAVAMLRGLLEPVTPRGHQAQCEIGTLLEHTAVQQAES